MYNNRITTKESDMKDTVRVSFDVAAERHIKYKTASVQSRISVKDFMSNLVELGFKEYEKAKLDQALLEGIQEAKEGKGRVISQEELDSWAKMVDDND
jgi:hypothetical protein